MNEIRQLTIFDIDGVLEDSVDNGIDSEQFLFNYNDEEAQRELEALEVAERVTGVLV